MSTLRIEGVEVTKVIEGTEPGDDTAFVSVQGGGATGCYGPVSEPIAAFAREILTPAVIGAEITDHVGLLDRMRATTRTAPSARASWAVGVLDCAVWDLHGRFTSRSVASLLSQHAPQASVPAYASWLTQDLTGMDGDLLRAVANGRWSFTKWGLRLPSGGTPDQAAAVMARALRFCARETGMPLAVDALGAWTVPVAMAFTRHIDISSLVWLEDPLPRHDLQAYARLAATGVPLAIGERASVEDDATELIGRVKPRALTIDVVGCGGLTRAMQILHVAQARHTPMYPHGRSLVPGLHLAAAFPEIIPAVEYRLQWESRRQRLYDVPIQPDQGRLHLPDSPGLGTTPRSTACPAPR